MTEDANAMRRIIRFSASCIGATVAVLALIWVFGGFSGLGLDGAGMTALFLGITFTIALAVGLMALIFNGDRGE
jgi:hypothetical protein